MTDQRRIPPIPPKEWPEVVFRGGQELQAPEGHPSHRENIRAGGPSGIATMETFAHHPDLVEAFFPFNGHILYRTSLSPRQRQILIIRVAAVRRSEYVWLNHRFTGREVGLTDEEMGRIAALGPTAPLFTDHERALIASVDEIIGDGEISDATWAALATELDHAQMLDVIFTVGCYVTVAAFVRSARLEPDPKIPELLDAEKQADDA